MILKQLLAATPPVCPPGDRSSKEEVGRLSLVPRRPHPPCSYLLCPADLLEARRPLAHECLGEALRVMRQVISKYPLLNTVETLTAAGTLIAKIRGQPSSIGQQGLFAWEGVPGGGAFWSGF